MSTTTVTHLDTEDLQQAYDGSWYTICGAGGDLQDWVNGLPPMLEGRGIGTPVEFFVTTGLAVNRYAERRNGGPIVDHDCFPENLTILMYPLTGLDVERLAIFKLRMGDRWFDDIVDNMEVK